MAHTALKQVLEVVENANLTRFEARDAMGEYIEYGECATWSDLADRIAECVANNSGMVTVEAWQQAPVRAVGQRQKDVPKPVRCKWRIRGTYGTAVPVAGEPARADAPDEMRTPPVSGMTVEQAVKQARLEWELERLRDELKARDEEEEEEEEEDATPQPVAGAALFGMSADQTFEILKGLKDAFLPKVAGAIAGAPALSSDDLAMFQAFQRFRQADPETASGLISTLLDSYGPNAKPPADAPQQ